MFEGVFSQEFDTTAGQEYHFGALRGQGVKSLLQYEWLINHPQGRQIGRGK